MKGRLAALVMAALVVLYIVLVGQRAVLLILSGSTVGVVMGVALLVLPVIGLWAIARELLFGVQTQRLASIMQAEGGILADELPHRASGRPVREEAEKRFPHYREAVEAAPEDWRAWFRLGLAYDGAGDRRRGRAALREAIRLHRAQSRGPSRSE